MEILNREVNKDGNTFIVFENTKKVYTYNDLVNEIQNIQRHKLHLIEQNRNSKIEYAKLNQEENELKEMLMQIELGELDDVTE